jgi:hypothetical protein
MRADEAGAAGADNARTALPGALPVMRRVSELRWSEGGRRDDAPRTGILRAHWEGPGVTPVGEACAASQGHKGQDGASKEVHTKPETLNLRTPNPKL